MSHLFPSLRNYQRDWIRGDAVAGLTVWAVLVPSALAYATIAGVPPVVGLYAAPAALVLYAALGSSRQLITGPSAAAAALSAAVVGNAVAGNGGQFVTTTAALAICVGLAASIAAWRYAESAPGEFAERYTIVECTFDPRGRRRSARSSNSG